MADDTTASSGADTSATDAAMLDMLGSGTQGAGAPQGEDKGADDGEKAFTQADLDRIVTERLGRERAQAATQIRDLTAKATRLDALERERMSESEKVAAERYDAGRADERREATAKLIDTHVLARVSAGRLAAEDAAEVLDSIDRSKFTTGDYEVDTDKLAKFLDRLSKPAGDGEQRPGYPDLGQGRRTPTKTSTGDQFAAAVDGFFR